MIKYQMQSFFPEFFYLLFGFVLLFFIQLKNIFCYFSKDHKFKYSSLFFEKEILISSCTPQAENYGSWFSYESNDKPLVSMSFERFLDKKAQIPILSENSHSCTLVGNVIIMQIPYVSHIPCDQHAKIHTWDLNMYKPLKFPLVLHDLPPKFFKNIPLFNGESDFIEEKHLTSFKHFTYFLDIQHEDVFMRLFTQALVGEVKRWFRNLPAELITSWTEFVDVFLHKWPKRKSPHQYLFDFYAVRRRNGETIMNFNRRFEILYHNLLVEILPSEVASKVYYALAHHPNLGFYLRERKYSTLEQMFIDAEEIENNPWTCGMLPDQIEEDLNTEEKKEGDEHEELDMHI
jgi:hypothetical protein